MLQKKNFFSKALDIISKGILILLIILVVTGNYICPFFRLFHIPCPGCGMTRAYISLLRFDFQGAFQNHALFPIPAIWAIYYLCGKHFKAKPSTELFWLIVSALLFIIRWITILIL